MTRPYRGESEAEFYGQLSPDDARPEVDRDWYDPALEDTLWPAMKQAAEQERKVRDGE